MPTSAGIPTPRHTTSGRGAMSFQPPSGTPASIWRRGTAPALPACFPLWSFEAACLARFAVSLPFVNYGGVVADAEDGGRSAELRRAESLARERGWRHVELRHVAQAVRALARQTAQGRDVAALLLPTSETPLVFARPEGA